MCTASAKAAMKQSQPRAAIKECLPTSLRLGPKHNPVHIDEPENPLEAIGDVWPGESKRSIAAFKRDNCNRCISTLVLTPVDGQTKTGDKDWSRIETSNKSGNVWQVILCQCEL